MKRLYRILSLALVCSSVFFYSCETLELDLTENPNALTPGDADINFYLNSIQEDFVRGLDGDADYSDNWSSGGFQQGDGFNDLGATLTRLYNYGSRDYASGIQAGDGDDEWRNTYAGMMIDIKNMVAIIDDENDPKNLPYHKGMAQFFEAFTMVTMVDFFGDVPLFEAVQGADNLNPVVDPGRQTYDAALALVDAAIANFNAESADAEPTYDLFYDGEWDLWVKACNTLKLKIYLQYRLVDPAGTLAASLAIINSGDYITSSDEDFEYNWVATSATNPDTRHPRYGLNYQNQGGNDYMSNWLMNLLDTTGDPRIRYYFYRQTDAVPGSNDAPPNEETLSCSLEDPPLHYIQGGFTFCYLDNGYWGRDHGDDDGIPPDGLLRTVWGVYPVGGRFDDDRFEAVAQGQGGGGAGITPILTAAWVDFYLAEWGMVNGDMAGAKAAMLAGTVKSIAKTQAFATLDGTADLSFEPEAADVSNFLDALEASFDSADEKGKWNVLSESYWVALFGNGVEAYNFYRRTGFPTTLQPNLEPDPGTFQRSMWYPDNAVNTNSNISQKPDQAQPVWWDTNPSAPEAN